LSSRVAVVLAVALTAVVCVLVPPIDRDTSHLVRLALAAFGVVLVGLRGLFAVMADRHPQYLRGLHAALAGAVTVGWFGYYQFDREVLTGINDWTDPAYYFTNSKYLGELSYDGLYAAGLTCDAERGSPRTGHVDTLRDLRDDRLVPLAAGLAHGQEVKAEFTPERWAAFCHDMTFFLDRIPLDSLERNFFVDHGYNPPPTWTIVGGTLASLVPVEHLKWVCMVDVFVFGGAVAAVGWVFGAEVVAWALLFFVTTFSGRWPILGMSILRFDWLAALMVGMALLKAGRHLGAGASIAFAAVNRVFPIVFFAPWLANAVRDTIAERRVPRRHVRFVAGAAIVSLLLGGLSLATYGTAVTADAAHNLAMHNRSYSSHRVGLGSVLLYRGETTRADINRFQAWCADPAERNGMARKEQCVQRLQVPLRGTALAAVAFLFLYAWRAKPEDWEILPLAILPFFCATNPQINYYNVRILLFIWHAALIRSPFHRLGIALLLLVEVTTQYTKTLGVERYATTSTASIGMAIYLSVVVAWMGARAIKGRPLVPG
jgi:hypothetical protein